VSRQIYRKERAPHQLDKAGFEVIAAVIMEGYIIKDVTLCSPLKVILRFGGTSRVLFQGRKISQA
jgi:hypothetical protein